jgi:lipopolysaccharide transport system ATP-binding protein
MSAAPVISVDRASKAYQIYAKPSDMLREVLLGGNRHDLFWALRDVSFEIFEKQRVGIIGPNGAGKSTLLQLITGNLQPTSGAVRVNGKISALLSLVPAWNHEDTGVENIRFNLLLQGCDPRKIPTLTEEIVEFTELGPFVYRPVKTYSSGMSARLSFAIATATQPDILIIDEILATGDAYFVGKAYKRMTDFCARGRALLFVSHATDAVRRMCDTVIWLQNGSIRQVGPTEYVLKKYEEDFRQQEDETLREENVKRSSDRRQFVIPGDLVESGLARFRLVPESGGHFLETHYVRRVLVEMPDAPAVDVSLNLVDLARTDVVAGLDLLSSEWGRIFEHRGNEARVLTRITGRSAGGHLLLKLPEALAANLPVKITVESMPLRDAEQLTIQLLNMSSAQWETLPVRNRKKLDGEWEQVIAEAVVPRVGEAEVQRTKEVVIAASAQPVEIEEVWLEARDLKSNLVLEREPFCVKLRVRANSKIRLADVGIKLMRTDGVYAFWQSSGMDAKGNLRDFEGRRIVTFCFDENLFGAGDYLVTAYAANGWDAVENYPYSEVFCRSVNALKFSIRPELDGLDFGQVNYRARVEVSGC